MAHNALVNGVLGELELTACNLSRMSSMIAMG
jgi:hypothetical protein